MFNFPKKPPMKPLIKPIGYSAKIKHSFATPFSSLSLGWRDLLVWLLLFLIVFNFSRYFEEAKSELQYHWNWQRVFQFFFLSDSNGKLQAGPILEGLLSTIKLALYSIITGIIIGVPIGILQVQKLGFLRLLGQFYVELIRNIPPLVIVTIFYFFFASPLIDWLDWNRLAAMLQQTCVVGLAFYLIWAVAKTI